MRPLTVGEGLDAAVALLRPYAGLLIGMGLALSAIEQAVLIPFRWWADSVRTPGLYSYEVDTDHWLAVWLTMSLGFGLEAMIIALLGGLAARAGGPALLGTPPTWRQLLTARDTRYGSVIVIALVAGLAGGGGALLCGLPWFVAYGFLGLAVPAAVIDRVGPGRALARSMTLVGKAGLRPAAIRLLGYAAWLVVRLALGWVGWWSYRYFAGYFDASTSVLVVVFAVGI